MGLKKGLWQCEGLRVCLYSIWSFETSTSHQSLVSYYVIYNHNWHILAKNEWGNTNLSHYHRRKVLPWKWRTEEVENNLLCLQTCLALVCLEIVRSLCLNKVNISCDLPQLAVMLQSERQICCCWWEYRWCCWYQCVTNCGQVLKESFYLISIKKQINSGLEWPAGPPKVHNSLTTMMTNIIIDESADHV